MRLDNSAFDKGLDESGRRFGKLQSVIASGVKTGAKVFAGMVTGASALGIAATKAGIEYNGLRQLAQAALTTVTGSAEEAAAQMERLDSFGATSWVMRDKLLEAQKLMTGFGIETEKVIPYLDGLQKGIAAAGQGNEEFSRAAEIMAEIQSNTKITGDHVRRLGILGIDAADAIGNTLGKSGEEVRKSITEGSLDAETALDALAEGLATKFPDAVENVRNTWQGAVDNMSAAWRDFGAELARPLVDPQGGGLLVGWVNELADTFWMAAEKARPLVDLLVQRFAPGIASVSPAIERVQGAINAWDISKVNSQLDSLTRYTPLIAGTSAALFALGTTNLPILSSLGFTGINPVVAGLAALVATSPAARDALSGVFSAASPLAETAKELGIALSDTLMYAIDELVPAAGSLAVAFVEAGVPLVQSLTPALVGLMEAAVPIVDIVAELARWVADLPTPLLAAGLAVAAFHKPLSSVVTLLTGAGAKVFQNVAQHAAAAGGQLEGMGVETSRVNIAMQAAKGSISGVGTALKAAFVSNAIGLAIAGVVAALGAFAAKQAEVRAAADSYKQTLDEMGNATQDTTNMIIEEATRVKNENYLEAIFGSGKSALERAEEIGVASDLVVGYIKGEEQATADLIAITEHYIETSDEEGRRRDHSEEKVRRFISSLDNEREALDLGVDQKKRAAEATDRLGDAEDEAADSVRAHTDALREQYDALLESADAAIGQSKALRRQEEAQDRTRDALKNLKKTTEDSEASERDLEKARRDVEAALDDEAAANIDLLGAMDRNNASTQELRSATRKARDAFIESAIQMGLNKQEAERLADSYGLIPEKINTTVTLDTANAKWQLDEFIRTQSGRTIHIRTTTSGTSYGHAGTDPRFVQRWRADGGIDVASFANGGFSRMPDQALIQPAKPGLVNWAEPSTQGEAFIPLAPSKRARSLQIWEETGRRLGAFAAKSFADGGFRSEGLSAQSDTGRRERRGPVINVYNQYPQAEPTSVTVNKALQFAAALGE